MRRDCGTAACIGGSIQALKLRNRNVEVDEREVGASIGLTHMQGRGLFFSWGLNNQNEYGYGWPQKFRKCFAKAKTAECKAEIACKLLELVVETEGKCLEPGYDEK